MMDSTGGVIAASKGEEATTRDAAAFVALVEPVLPAAYRLAVLRATEDVENAFSALVKREDQAGILGQGVDSLSRARGGIVCGIPERGRQPYRSPASR